MRKLKLETMTFCPVQQRTEQYLNIIAETVMQKIIPVEEIYYSEGRKQPQEWMRFGINTYWGKHDTWYWFKTKVVIPAEYDDERVELQITTGREDMANRLNPQFLVRINGKIVQALDTNHHSVCLAQSAKTGDEYEILLEAYAGREPSNIPFKNNPLVMEMCTYALNKKAEKLYYDLYVPYQAAKMLKERDYNRILIENYLDSALNLLDVRVPSSAEYFASVDAAAEYLKKEFYEKECGKNRVIANCIGHTHIDITWLWTLEQTRAKAVRSFSTELALLDEYPEHSFTSSQAQLYQFVKEDAPEVYERIKEKVKEGRWEVEGAMWLEADCNLPSGESLIRQILHGKRFMKEEFDVDAKVLWLPDVFGYSAALPQILKKSGVETFVTSKIHWSETNLFPYDTFMWKGIDGTEIFSQFITGGNGNAILGNYEDAYSNYCGEMTTNSIAKGWEIYKQKNINNEILVSFGFGDGGGGVTREMLEMQRRMSYGIPGVPKTRITTVADTIERIKNNVKGKQLPKWVGELYLELHRATYTSTAQIKLYNRMCEFLLQHTETLSLTDKLLLGGIYDKKALYDSWKKVLLNQFHDTLPGTSIKEVYEDSYKMYDEVISDNKSRSENALKKLAHNVNKEGIFVYNPTGIVQSGLVTVDGEEYYAKDVPALGWKVIDKTESSDTELIVTNNHMENQFFIIEFNEEMAITSIYDKKNDREVIQSGKCGNVLQALDDHPRAWEWDNWEVTQYVDSIMWEINNVADVKTEKNNEKAAIEITRNFMSSQFVQKIIIYKDIPRIDFDTDVDWNEHHIFVKAAFPVDILSDKATYEIQYGAVERPTHKNTSWDAAKFEVCAHKWADYAEGDYGVALMNDCKYGYDVHDGVMRLSLIKCGTYPNPDADIGHHHFCYSIMPHNGDWRQAEVVKASFALNCPLMATKTLGTGTLSEEYSFASVNKPNIIISTMKEACDSEDIVIRMYEANGTRCNATLDLGFAVRKVYDADLMENELKEIEVIGNSVSLRFKPYEIKTLIIKIR